MTWNDAQQMLVALIVLAIVAAVVGSKQASLFVGAAGKFLASMVQKVERSA